MNSEGPSNGNREERMETEARTIDVDNVQLPEATTIDVDNSPVATTHDVNSVPPPIQEQKEQVPWMIPESERIGEIYTKPTSEFPAEKQCPPKIVTPDQPFRSNFSKDVRYIHCNVRNDHRFHRSGQGTPSYPPYSVEEYIEECIERNNALDGRRFEIIKPQRALRSNAPRCSRELAWKKLWKHTGPVSNLLCVQPCDTIYLRAVEEQQYQKDLCTLIMNIKNKEVDDWEGIWDAPPTLPRPITEWYMFSDRMLWEEDSAFEARHRSGFRKNQQDFRPPDSKKKFIHWHQTFFDGIPMSAMEDFFFHADTFIADIEPSVLCHAPSAPLTAYYLDAYNTGTVRERHLIRCLVHKEQVEMDIAAWVYRCCFGCNYTKCADPRMTDSNGYGLITPIPEKLKPYMTDAYLIELYYGSSYNLAKVLCAVRRAKGIDWNWVRKQMVIPFLFYDWGNATVQMVSRMEEREVYVQRHRNGEFVTSWRVRVFPGVIPGFVDYVEDNYTLRGMRSRVIDLLTELGYNNGDRADHTPGFEVNEAGINEDENGNIDDEIRGFVVQNEDNWYSKLSEYLRPVYRETGSAPPETPMDFVTEITDLLKMKQQKEGAEKALESSRGCVTVAENRISQLSEEIEAQKRIVAEEKKKYSYIYTVMEGEKARCKQLEEFAMQQADRAAMVANNLLAVGSEAERIHLAAFKSGEKLMKDMFQLRCNIDRMANMPTGVPAQPTGNTTEGEAPPEHGTGDIRESSATERSHSAPETDGQGRA